MTIPIMAAGAELLARDGAYVPPTYLPLSVAVAVALQTDSGRARIGATLAGLAAAKLQATEEGHRALVALWRPFAGVVASDTLPGAQLLIDHPRRGDSRWERRVLEALDMLGRRPGGPLSAILRIAVATLPRSIVEARVLGALDTLSTVFVARSDWLRASFELDPSTVVSEMAHTRDPVAVASLVESLYRGRHAASLVEDDPATRAPRLRLIAPMVLRSCRPGTMSGGGWVEDVDRVRDVAEVVLAGLARDADDEAGIVLTTLLGHADVAPWHARLRSVAADRAARIRDARFVSPDPEALASVLRRGPPRTAADLAAVGCIELRALRDALRTDDVFGWRSFWNRSPIEGVIDPLGENDCRDLVVNQIRRGLERYGVPGTLPEVQHSGATRVDILLRTDGRVRFPIEVKRAHNDTLWTAPTTQLAGYARHPDASGLGAYLVLWFGGAYPTPAYRGKERPTTAEELVEALREVTPSEFDVIVLDLSEPPGSAKTKTKRRAKRRSPPESGGGEASGE